MWTYIHFSELNNYMRANHQYSGAHRENSWARRPSVPIACGLTSYNQMISA